MDGTVAPWSVNPNFLGIYSSASNVTKKYEKCEIKSINGWEKTPGHTTGIPTFLNWNQGRQ